MKIYLNNEKKSIYLTILTVLFPILSVYFLNVGISLADFLLLFGFPFLLLKLTRICYIRINLNVAFLICYILLHTLVFTDISQTIVNTSHFLLVLFVIGLFCGNLYDREIAIKIFVMVSVVASIYLILQVVLLRGLGIYVPGQISILKYSVASTGNIRPFSFFSEPSSFGWYNSVGLATILYNKSLGEKKKMILASIVSLSLFMSTSTTSVGLMVLVWIIWGKDNKEIRQKLLLAVLLFGIPVLGLINIRYGVVGEIIQHSFVGIGSGNYAGGLLHRIGDLNLAFNCFKEYSIITKLFGIGMVEISNIASYLPSIGRIYIYYGLTGYFIIGFFMVSMYRQSGKYGRCLIFLAIFAMFFSESIFGIMMLTYMPYVISWLREDYNHYEKRNYTNIF